MRQLVAIVKDGHVNYIVADDDGVVDQIARIKVPDTFDVEDTVTLGFTLIDSLHLNGTRRPRQPALAPEAPVPAALPPARTRAATFTADDVVAYIFEHPGSRSGEIADALMPGVKKVGSTLVRQAVDNRLRALVNRHQRQGTVCPVRVVNDDGVARWYPV